MIVGVGVDIVSVSRARRAFEKPGDRLLKRVFSEPEIHDLGDGEQRWQRIAARFAAKEAVMKSLGVGIWQVGFADIQLYREPGGKPEVILLGRALRRAGEICVTNVLLSMSHEQEYAVAYAVAVGGETQC